VSEPMTIDAAAVIMAVGLMQKDLMARVRSEEDAIKRASLDNVHGTASVHGQR
jgi:hypothetical protein